MGPTPVVIKTHLAVPVNRYYLTNQSFSGFIDEVNYHGATCATKISRRRARKLSNPTHLTSPHFWAMYLHNSILLLRGAADFTSKRSSKWRSYVVLLLYTVVIPHVNWVDEFVNRPKKFYSCGGIRRSNRCEWRILLLAHNFVSDLNRETFSCCNRTTCK